MRILVTVAKGFVGRNLWEQLKNIKGGKACNYGVTVPNCIYENVSTKIVKIIQSYSGVVNKMVWGKFYLYQTTLVSR